MAVPEQLLEDRGEYFRDPNAARYPSYPLQPAVEAILRMKDTFDSNSVDIVACGSTMGNLLRFVRNIDKDFRIIIEAVGSTIFFVRRENSPTETIPGVRGYGHTFPGASTTWEEGVKGSESHQRIVQYNFAGLRCVVRFEADGYFPTSPISQTGYALNEVQNEADLLSALFEGSTVTSHAPEDKERLDDDILGEDLPRMWVLQIRNFILAFHEYGLFNDVRVQNVCEEVKIWEREQETSLRQFAALLKVLIAFAQGRADGRFEIVHDEESKILQFRELDKNVNRALPESLKERWSSGSTAAVVLGGISSDDWVEVPNDELMVATNSLQKYYGRPIALAVLWLRRRSAKGWLLSTMTKDLLAIYRLAWQVFFRHTGEDLKPGHESATGQTCTAENSVPENVLGSDSRGGTDDFSLSAQFNFPGLIYPVGLMPSPDEEDVWGMSFLQEWEISTTEVDPNGLRTGN
ncbi:hypothetical protein BDV30DRAFT_234506 [Aspergillus minisclerotigenes]|uniref:Uncharacterized protein n=1 Tax=Aspergillus minisclerotigenes TaxID=656917 RepID=A0A5N6JFJ0_9EURO|nr:hypothetical protein BDV30DRAFT_234506 [Aspergillus minisclerotigenes]